MLSDPHCGNSVILSIDDVILFVVQLLYTIFVLYLVSYLMLYPGYSFDNKRHLSFPSQK